MKPWLVNYCFKSVQIWQLFHHLYSFNCTGKILYFCASTVESPLLHVRNTVVSTFGILPAWYCVRLPGLNTIIAEHNSFLFVLVILGAHPCCLRLRGVCFSKVRNVLFYGKINRGEAICLLSRGCLLFGGSAVKVLCTHKMPHTPTFMYTYTQNIP